MLRRPWLLLPASLSHSLFPFAVRAYTSLCKSKSARWQSFQWRGLVFKNRIGIAGGVDKNADLINHWEDLGCGFIEVGTITPLPQKPNPGLIMDRDSKHKTLWNKMGFPSAGMDEVYYNLLHRKSTLPVFVNIGKNRQTANEEAAQDYISCMDRLHSVSDVFVINISSPNTSGLRELQDEKHFVEFLTPLKEKATLYNKPILVKLSPDVTDDQLKFMITAIQNVKIDGVVLTNTTLQRKFKPSLSGLKSFPEQGGLSGQVLTDMSYDILQKTVRLIGANKKDFLIVSVGGLMTPEDIQKRLEAGADLVQCYSALVFEGLGFFHKVHQHFKA